MESTNSNLEYFCEIPLSCGKHVFFPVTINHGMSQDGPIVFVDVATEYKNVYTPEEPVTETVAVQNNTNTSSIQNFKCNECNRTVDSEEKLSQHIRRAHRGENAFQCSMCQYSTYNKSGFEEHVRIHQGIKPFKCSYCPYRSVSKKYAKKHELIHRPDNPLRCQHCPYIARNYRMLNSHQKKLHGNEKQRVIIACTLCGKKFDDMNVYFAHKKRRKQCDECGLEVCHQAMNRHKHEKHGVKRKVRGKDVFTCKICEWSSVNKVKVLLHIIHHPEQDLSDCSFDLSVLKKCQILPP